MAQSFYETELVIARRAHYTCGLAKAGVAANWTVGRTSSDVPQIRLINLCLGTNAGTSIHPASEHPHQKYLALTSILDVARLNDHYIIVPWEIVNAPGLTEFGGCQ
jgi:hypothetical protein